jgi:hypothetical protein
VIFNKVNDVKKVRPFTSHVKMMTLTLVLPHYDRWFYPREIQHITGIAYTPVRTSLISLCDGLGLVKRRQQGSRYFYSVDRDFFLYQEYKSIVFKTTGLADHLRWQQSNDRDIEAVFLHGDFADGTETTESPVRFCIVGDLPEKKLKAGLEAAEKLTQKTFIYTRFTRRDFVQALESKHQALAELLNGPSLYLVGSRSKLLADRQPV